MVEMRSAEIEAVAAQEVKPLRAAGNGEGDARTGCGRRCVAPSRGEYTAISSASGPSVASIARAAHDDAGTVSRTTAMPFPPEG